MHPYYLALWRTQLAPQHVRCAFLALSHLTPRLRRAPRARSGTSLRNPEAPNVARVNPVRMEVHQCQTHDHLIAPRPRLSVHTWTLVHVRKMWCTGCSCKPLAWRIDTWSI